MKFDHIDASSIEDATSLLQKYGGKAWIIAGGTDVIGTMRFEILDDYPEALINLKSIPGMDYITEENGTLRIGALARLHDISVNSIVKADYPALAEAAGRTASPHVREMGTIGGNICQLIRCWYFRKEENRFDCIRKGGKMCHAVLGDNRYHSIFGAVRVGDPPCAQKCPAGTDIPGYLASIRDGALEKAAKALIEYNPLAAMTGRICPHFCESECNRNELDESVSIRLIERAVGDYILAHADEFYRPPQKESGKRVAVIGSGPAGLTAAYYLRNLGHAVAVIEEFDEPGGMLMYGIPAYRLQQDDVRKQIKALENMGIRFQCRTTVGKDVTLEKIKGEYDAVFCATGAWKQASLGIEDEDLLTFGLAFLKQVANGERKRPAKNLLVIGGGSVAMDVAITARRLGVRNVTVACLESEAEMPALREEVIQAQKEGIKLMPSWGPSAVIKNNGQLAGMELVRCSSVYDSQHRFSPVYDTSVKEKIEADQVMLAIGQRPDLSWTGDLLEQARGLVAVDVTTQATNLAGVFAGGDATIPSGSASVVAAIAAGRRAASSINQHLGGQALPEPEKKIEHLQRASSSELEHTTRVRTPEVPASQVTLDAEDARGLDYDQVATEARRCFNCGCDGVNPSDTAPALVALDATIVTSKRTIKADDFWVADRGLKPTALEDDEIVTEIRIPKPKSGINSAFIKFAMRKSIDFPIVNCVAAIRTEGGVVKSARVCLNAVYSNPYRATKAEGYIIGKAIDEETADEAGAAVVADAIALPYNKFKIQIAKTLVKRAILACR